MSWTDLTYYASNAGIVPTNTDGAIVGAGSLLVTKTGGASMYLNGAWNLGGTGFPRGRIRVILDAMSFVNDAQWAGLVCMQSQHNLTAGGSAYGLLWKEHGITLDLVKTTNGLANWQVLAHVAISASNMINTFQLDWAADDQLGWGGTKLYGWHGLAYNFSDLAQVLEHTDATAPLVSSVNQGVCVVDASANNSAWRFDSLWDYEGI